MKGTYITAIFVLLIVSGGCVKETYDLDVLSRDAQLSPVFVLPAIRGSLTFEDLVKPGKPIASDDDGQVKIVFRKDSVVNLTRDDFYDLEERLAYSHQFRLGNLKIDPFGGSVSATPAEITSTILRKIFPAFTNFITASFASGYADVVVRNEMNHAVEGMVLSFSTSSGPVRSQVIIPSIQPGSEYSFSLNISGVEMSNIMSVAVTGASIPGADRDLQNIEGSVVFVVKARDPKISAGKAIIPQQTLSDHDSINYIDLTAGDGVELDRIKLNEGRLLWNATTPCLLTARIGIICPTITRNGSLLKENITINPLSPGKGSIQLAKATIGLNSDPVQPFNRFPYQCEIVVSSNGSIVRFNANEQVDLGLQLAGADPEYIKGYFGQQVHSIAPQSLNTGIAEYSQKLNGNIQFTDPSVRLHYSNSFSLPIEVALDVEGRKKSEGVSLGLDPFPVSYPSESQETEVRSTYIIGKDNSLLPDLISLLPDEIIFSGAAKFNTKGEAKESRDNYIYDESRFVASVEVEIPLKMKFDSIHLADTMLNFLKGEKLSESLSESKGNTSAKVRIASLDLKLKNSFPFDVSFNLGFISDAKNVNYALNAGKVLKAAQTDVKGRVVSPSETVTTVHFEPEFLEKLNTSDKIIFDFCVNTGINEEIRIFTDYKIEFSASVKVNTEFNFELP